MAEIDYLIVGAGFAGSVCAERLAAAGKSVLLCDQRSHVAGNAYDEYNADGILIHRYGPHIFHTNSEKVWTYLSHFTTWRPYEHRVCASLDGIFVPVPINRDTLAHFHGDLEAAKAAIITPYTRKQWGCEPSELDPSVLARIPVRDTAENRYFLDTYQAMPADGFTALVERMLCHPKIALHLNCRASHGMIEAYPGAHVIWTAPLDEFFDRLYGALPYRSANFQFDTVSARQLYPVGVVNYPSPLFAHTRVTEFKHLTGQPHRKTTIAMEYPTDNGEPFWPVPKPANLALAQRYRLLATNTAGVSFCGRLGTYQYLNIDQVVGQALALVDRLLERAA